MKLSHCHLEFKGPSTLDCFLYLVTIILFKSQCHLENCFVSLWQIRKESEEDKQRAVAHAVATRIHNVERACQEADKQCHDEFEAERKRINQAHAAEISAVKKKQWVIS